MADGLTATPKGPATPQQVRIDLGARSYDILVGHGLLADAGRHLRQAGIAGRVVVITDEAVAAHHRAPLEAALMAADLPATTITVAPGEGSKDWRTLQSVVERILALGIERRTALVALGGGVVGDLCGFAAAVALRGVPFVQIPTTLLAQVDSSVGGKTGINSAHGKNLVGAFYQPRLVLADLTTLSTLPPRQWRAGYAEVAKYGALGDVEFFGWLEKAGPRLTTDAAALTHAVTESCRAKARIVAEDEHETGRRALLNLGHTFGHALEAAAGYGDTLLHGEAVAIGMVIAARLSARLGLCPASDVTRLASHLQMMGLPTAIADVPGLSPTPAALLDSMGRDKKVDSGRMRFVLLRGLGDAFVTADVDPADVVAVLEEG